MKKTILYYPNYRTAYITCGQATHKINKEMLAYYLTHYTLKKSYEGKCIWFELEERSPI